MVMSNSTFGKIVSHNSKAEALAYAKAHRSSIYNVKLRETASGWETKTTRR